MAVINNALTFTTAIARAAQMGADAKADGDADPYDNIDPQELIFDLTGLKIDPTEEQDEDILTILTAYEDGFWEEDGND